MTPFDLSEITTFHIRAAPWGPVFSSEFIKLDKYTLALSSKQS
jgi:hypothetical protein